MEAFDLATNATASWNLRRTLGFVGADVCRVLEFCYRASLGFAHHLKKLGKDEVPPIAELGVSIPKTAPASKAISESGLYKLVMRSDKPQAREFQDWVTRVVLPAIRKEGANFSGEEGIGKGTEEGDEAKKTSLPEFRKSHCTGYSYQ